MSENIIQVNNEFIHTELKNLVRKSVEETLNALLDCEADQLAGVSVRRAEDISELLWNSKVSSGTISNLNKKAYENIEEWRNRPLSETTYPYVFIDGIFLKSSWGGSIEKISVLIVK